VSKNDFEVIKITIFAQLSGYLGNMGALGPKMSIPMAYLVPKYHFFNVSLFFN